ncbi:inner nuclear membrane protein Man1-like isoform X1 [Branchiostoma lanceolatum]|uniref:inner nuclear membrane protein Man1-like isoform X1 n=1 Tax=Branchiostoma lanceolatum TaxID=7740 RepID=UPI0034522AE8
MAAQLTDEELRAELKALGQNVGPVTATTRRLYETKLTQLRSQRRKSSTAASGVKPSRKLIGFSSDESEGEAAERNGQKFRHRRTPKSRPSRTVNRSENSHEHVADSRGASAKARVSVDSRSSRKSGVLGSVVGARRRGATPPVHDHKPTPDDEEYSDTDGDMPDGQASSYAVGDEGSSVNGQGSFDMNRTFNKTGGDATPPSFSLNTWGSGKNSTPRTSTPTKPSTPDTNSRLKPIANHHANHIHSNRKQSKMTVWVSSPLSRPPLPTHRRPPSSSPTPQQPNGGTPPASKNYNSEEDILQKEFQTAEDLNSVSGGVYWGQYVSRVLLVLMALFFLVLALMYLNVRWDLVTPKTTTDNFLLCGPDVTTEGCSENKNEVAKALEMVHHLHHKLSVLAGEYLCGDQDFGLSRNMSRSDAVQFLSKYGCTKPVFSLALRLITENPHWGVRLMTSKGEDTAEVDAVDWLESTQPDMPLLCRLQRAFSIVFLRILAVLACAAMVWGGVELMRYRWRRQEEDNRLMYNMIERILDALKKHAEACRHNTDLQPYLAIPHVRDMLIPPQERKKLGQVWDRAVKFLSANESRIRVESQQISGEPFTVWRWINVDTPNNRLYPPINELSQNHTNPEHEAASGLPQFLLGAPRTGRVKAWQGEAFDVDSSVNSRPYSPTPCLKIRNMFDPDIETGEDWHVHIQDAILEKCGDNNGIVHIAVDKSSREGCVYLKCNSHDAAGKAFRALHGSWFDGKLVTVKYLWLDRYHQRFPDALHAAGPLRPSNPLKTSLMHLDKVEVEDHLL